MPLLTRMGAGVELGLQYSVFHLAGGGSWRARIQPLISLLKLDLTERCESLRCKALASSVNIPAHVGQRELAQISKLCGWLDEHL
ncbi:hypothetical protein [Microbulbifer sp. THAF38]|uniref:hypothetical protein n=1 Tax=Microbulbifer sp. THAF38 TaxID=2587856 RepID=UPI0012681E69|nr:hypothetical protein [Microbulbifer sp. THAF38]